MPIYNTACSIPAHAKTNASLQPPMSSLPPHNTILLQTCTTGTHDQNTRSAPSPPLNPIHTHTFGFTTYIMDANYRTAKSSPNGPNNFLSYSNGHVGIILPISTGLTSSPFHIQYDSSSKTMRHSFGNQQPISQRYNQRHSHLSPTKHKTNDSTNYQKHIDQTTQFMREKAQFMREKTCRLNNSIHEGDSSQGRNNSNRKGNIQGTHEGA
jgi:hypothetical protein